MSIHLYFLSLYYFNCLYFSIDLYDNLLLTRIKLQKCLVAANRLPQPKNKIDLSTESIDNSQTIKALQQFLDTLLSFKTKLLTRNNDFMKTM